MHAWGEISENKNSNQNQDAQSLHCEARNSSTNHNQKDEESGFTGSGYEQSFLIRHVKQKPIVCLVFETSQKDPVYHTSMNV